MNSPHSNIPIEEIVRDSFEIPEVNAKFVDQLFEDLNHQARKKKRINHRLSPKWRTVSILASALLFLMIITTLLIGPHRVYAEIMKIFGYIPGGGIVDLSSPIRVIAEPVSLTRDDISVTVTSAILTDDQTQIEYRIFGVPGSAYPDREDVTGCMQREYLRLPDGKRLVQTNFGYEPVPMDANEAVFVIPCIVNTLPGKIPENWELPLRFIPAPTDMTVMPVTELATPEVTLAQEESDQDTPSEPSEYSVIVNKEIETSDGYILVGHYEPQEYNGAWAQMAGGPEILDATGKDIAYVYPQDVTDAINQEPPLSGWAAEFKAAGLTYPLTIRLSGFDLHSVEAETNAEFTFDAGADPQPGQSWAIDQEFELAGHRLKLETITALQNGYTFQFQVDPEIYAVNVQIEGFVPEGGGGGGGGGLADGRFSTSLRYSQLPTGLLKVTISNLVLIGDTITWEGVWSPASPHANLSGNNDAQLGVCLTAESIEGLASTTDLISAGKALIYEKLDSGNWGLTIYNIDGSLDQIVNEQGNWGALSPDGSQVAYSSADNKIHIFDLVSQTEQVLPGAGGFDIHWSPDGNQVAYVGMGNGFNNSVFILGIDGGQPQQISEWSYESVVGWSPDGNQLYFVAPYTGGAAWKVYAYDLNENLAEELFTIENGTPKLLNPQLSPDGNWIAYRGRDNSSLYRIRTDGSDMELLLEDVGAVGVGWSQSGWLGLSLRIPDSDESKIIFLNPESCEVHLMPEALNGELQGLYLP